MNLLVLPALAGLLSVALQDAKDLDRLQGDWIMISSVRDGKEVLAAQARAMRRTIQGDQYTITRDGKVAGKGTIKLDPSKNPRAIDVIRSAGPDKGKPMLGIYTIEGDVQKVCLAKPGQPRPTDFTAPPGSGRVLTVWKRFKE